MPESAVLVGSGEFLVDRARALEKLRQFQLPDPHLFAVPLIRAAVAGGAKRVELECERVSHQPLVRIVFNGQPFSKDELEDPFGCLFLPRKKGMVRNRLFAIGLLSALRVEPISITVESGLRTDRQRMRMDSLQSDIQIEPSPERGRDDTVITLLGRDSNTHRILEQATAHLEEAALKFGLFDLCPIPIRINGTSIPRYPVTPPDHFAFVPIQDGHRTGWVTLPAIGAESALHAYTWGVRVETTDLFNAADGGALPVRHEVRINDDGFTLNASHSAVVRNARWREAAAAVRASLGALILKVIEAQEESAERIGSDLKEEKFLRVWKRLWEADMPLNHPGNLAHRISEGLNRLLLPPDEFLSRVVSAAAASFGGYVPPEVKVRPGSDEFRVQRMKRYMRQACWLREACRMMLSDHTRDQSDEIRRALWRAPVLYGVDRSPLSLEDLMDERRRLGYVPYADKLPEYFRQPARTFRVAWVSVPSDLSFLQHMFEVHVKNMVLKNISENLVKAALEAGASGLQPTSLDMLGSKELLVRSTIRDGGGHCDVGLTVLPPPAAQIRFLCGRNTRRLREFAVGLRFVADVSHPSLNLVDIDSAEPPEIVRQMEQQVLREACGLYRKLMPQFDLGTRTSQMLAIREHLWDFARFASTRPPELDVGVEWIETVELFRSPSGTCRTLRQIDDRLRAGDPIRYRLYAGPQDAGDADLILDDMELEFLAGLWPERTAQLVDVECESRQPGQMPAPVLAARIADPVPPAAPVAPSEPPPEPVAPVAQKKKRSQPAAEKAPDDIVSMIRGLMKQLKGRHGVKLSDAGISSIDLASGDGREVLSSIDRKSWRLSRNNALVRTILESRIPLAAQRDYLASVLYTAVNRSQSDILDRDDVAFQEALVDALTAREPSS